MKKNLLTILLTILIIVLLLFLGNLLRNFLILKGICNSNEEFKNSKQGYHFTSTTYPNLTFIKSTKSDMYFYNGVYFIKTYINNELVYSYETTNANSTGVSTKIFSGFNIFTRNAKGKIYYAKLFDNESNIIWNGIPCLDTNGTPCMYDTVSGQTFYNQGTGEFIAGPIVE